MKPLNRKRIVLLILCILVPLALGGISSVLTKDQMKIYHFLNKPPLSPPTWVFPIAWTILYLLMGLAWFRVLTSEADQKTKDTALLFFGLQLALNFFWSLVFFNASAYLVAFIMLMAMWVLIILCTIWFFRIDRKAGWLMVPYIAWTTFAAYLNLAVYILSITPSIRPR